MGAVTSKGVFFGYFWQKLKKSPLKSSCGIKKKIGLLRVNAFELAMITCTGFLVKHVMLIVFGVRARHLLRQKNDLFDIRQQNLIFFTKQSLSFLEALRRLEAVIKLIPQTILQIELANLLYFLKLNIMNYLTITLKIFAKF